MEFFENLIETNVVGCQCDDYCDDTPNGPTGCDDNNEGWHSGD